ncbi:MAG: aminotransferase class IV, partial [Asticcacaulis sp.]
VGLVYLQVSRGAAPRDHAFPGADLPPTVVVTAKAVDRAQQARKAAQGVAVITVPENRWGRCDIKTVGLLPNCLAKTKARDAGASEAWFVDAEGYVTEGTSTNAWIVTQDGVIVTRDLGANILHGVTRRTILALAAEQGLRFEERPFTVDEAKAAAEAFFSAATALVMPAVSIDGVKIGDGTPGPLARGLREAYITRAFVTAE